MFSDQRIDLGQSEHRPRVGLARRVPIRHDVSGQHLNVADAALHGIVEEDRMPTGRGTEPGNGFGAGLDAKASWHHVTPCNM